MSTDRREAEGVPSTALSWLDVAVLAAVVVFVAGVYAPMAATGTRLSDSEDFLALAARQEFLRKSLFAYGVFPLRSHFFGSGYPTASDPEDTALSPLTWCLLALPSTLALKLRALIGAIAAAVGTYLLGRRGLGYTRWGGAFSALVFPLAFWLPERVSGGNPSEMLAGFIPLCLFLVLTAPRRPLRFAWLPLLFYTMLADGKQSLLAALVFMGIVCAAWCLPVLRGATRRSRRERFHPLIYLALATLFGLLISLVRVLPVMETLLARGGVWHPPPAPGTEWPFLTAWQAVQGLLGLRGLVAGSEGLYVGPVPVVLFLGGVVLAWRRAAVWGLAALVVLWLALGPNAPVNLLAALHRLPLGGSFDRPLKWFVPLVALGISLGAGAFFGPLLSLRPRWVGHLLAGAATAGAVVALAPEAVRMTADPFVRPAPPSAPGTPEDFYSVAGVHLARNRMGPPNAEAYFNLRRNVGTIDWYPAWPLPEHGQPRYFVDRSGRETPNPDYRGEAHFLKPINWCRARFEPNRIQVEVNVLEPDWLIINQNFHPGWRADRGALAERDGLLALRLEGRGEYQVVLRYVSDRFTVGALLSVCGLGALAGFVVLRGRGRFKMLASPAAESPPQGPAADWGRGPAWLVLAVMGAIVLVPMTVVGLENWDAFRLLRQGDRCYMHGDLERAGAAYRRALKAEPGSATAHHHLGLCLEMQGDAEGALARYREAVRLDPGLARAHDNLASLLADQGAYAAAVEALRAGLAAVPDDAQLMRRLAGLLAACPDDGVRDGPEAVLLAERLVGATKRRDPNALDLLAGAYAEVGRFEEAVQTAREAVRLAAADSPEQAREIRSRLRLYEARKPYRMPAKIR